MTNVLQEIVNLKKEYEEKVKSVGSSLIVDLYRPLFNENPGIDSIRWEQYTPYFNDGDTCVFGVGELRYKLTTPSDKEHDEYGDGYAEAYNIGQKWDTTNRKFIKVEVTPELKAVKEMAEIHSNVPDDIMLSLFGDHAQITIFNDGKLEVEEYEHE